MAAFCIAAFFPPFFLHFCLCFMRKTWQKSEKLKRYWLDFTYDTTSIISFPDNGVPAALALPIIPLSMQNFPPKTEQQWACFANKSWKTHSSWLTPAPTLTFGFTDVHYWENSVNTPLNAATGSVILFSLSWTSSSRRWRGQHATVHGVCVFSWVHNVIMSGLFLPILAKQLKPCHQIQPPPSALFPSKLCLSVSP